METCPKSAYTARRGAGFTLIELMMVLVLVAILLGIGGPSFQDSLRRNRMQSTLNEMAGALALARGEAVVRAQPVAMCPTTDRISCGGAAWETGYLVFVDDGQGGGTAADGLWNGAEEYLRIGEPAPAGVTVRTIGFTGPSSIAFEADGRIQQRSTGSVQVCDARGASDASGLVVSVSGQARLATDEDGNTLDDVRDEAFVAQDIACP